MRLCTFEIGDASIKTWLNIVFRLEEKCKIKHLCTDGNPVYGYYKIAENHHITKSETCLVESWNSKLRYYISGLVRKTKCYFKSEKTLKMAMDFFNLIHNTNPISN